MRYSDRRIKKLHDEDNVHNLYYLTIIIGIIKSNMGEIGGVCSAHGEMINAYRSLLGNPVEKKHLEDLGEDERTVPN
jgi:hypothetical protein